MGPIHKLIVLDPPHSPFEKWGYRLLRVVVYGDGYSIGGLRDFPKSRNITSLDKLREALLGEFDPNLVNDIVDEVNKSQESCTLIFKVPFKIVKYKMVEKWDQWGW